MAILTSTATIKSLNFVQLQLRQNNKHTRVGKSIYFASMDVQQHYDRISQLLVLMDVLEEPGFSRVQQMARQRLLEFNEVQIPLFPSWVTTN